MPIHAGGLFLLEGEAVLKALSLLQALSLSKCRSAESQTHAAAPRPYVTAHRRFALHANAQCRTPNTVYSLNWRSKGHTEAEVGESARREPRVAVGNLAD